MKIGQQTAQGLFFLLFGAACIGLGRTMAMGTAADMGVGYVPRALAVGCMLVGAGLLGQGLMTRERVEPLAFALRPLLVVTTLVLAFAALLPWFGLPLTIMSVVLAAAMSGERFHWPLLLATALGLALGSTLLFHRLLRLQVPVWPSW